MGQKKRVGLVCGGGDCPGLNAVIRAFVHRATLGHGMEVVGIQESLQGLLRTPPHVRTLDVTSVSGILTRGGTILGTTNRHSPFAFPITGAEGNVTAHDRSHELATAVKALGLEGIVFLGGDGTMAMAHRLMSERGVRAIGVPKTIDNDLAATDVTFGFLSAVDVATDAVDRLHSTAESHDRVMILEVMGRHAGHIALTSGVAGGADVVLLPEIPFSMDAVVAKIRERTALGKYFSIIVVAEGACPVAGTEVIQEAARVGQAARLGGIGALVAAELTERFQLDARVTVLGHLQRGGSPVPLDRVIASALGVHAANLAATEKWGQMATIKFPGVSDVPLASAVGKERGVGLNGALVQTARSLGICLGDASR